MCLRGSPFIHPYGWLFLNLDTKSQFWDLRHLIKTKKANKDKTKTKKEDKTDKKHIVWKESLILYIRAVSHSCDVSIKGHIFHQRYLRFNLEGNNWNVSSLKCFRGGFVQNVPNIISFFQIKQTLSCLWHFPHILSVEVKPVMFCSSDLVIPCAFWKSYWQFQPNLYFQFWRHPSPSLVANALEW